MTTVPVQGARIFVQDRGSGPPVLLLHGNPDTSDLWSGVIDGLASDFRCIAPDLPGFGRSEIPGDFDFRLQSMADFVDALVGKLGLSEPIRLAVHDFGGPYGLSWAVRHPERVAALGITNTLYSSRYRWHFWARVWRTPGLGELSMALMSRWIAHWEMRRGSKKLPREYVDQMWEHVDPETQRMVLKLYRATNPRDFRGWEDELRTLARRVPTKVLWGAKDPYTPLWMAHIFGTGEVEIFPDAGHWLPVEEPRTVAKGLAGVFTAAP